MKKFISHLNSPYALAALAIVVALLAGAAVNLASFYGAPITGYASGFVYINVSCSTSITLVNSTVTFGAIAAGATNNTRDTFPPALYVRNDGNVPVNISIRATSIFTSIPNPTIFFGYACGNTTEHTCTCVLNTIGANFTLSPDLGCNTTSNAQNTLNGTGQNGTQITFSAIPLNTLPAALVQYNFTFNDTNDELEIDINISIPSNESAGAKESNVTVLATSTQPATECV